jgi:hypothetical protein
MATQAFPPAFVDLQYHLKSTLFELRSWRSNDMPPSNTQQRIHRLIFEAVETYRRLNSLFWVYPIDKPGFKDLMESRAEQVERYWLLRTAVSSLKKVPPEILSEIFSYCSAGAVTLPPRGDEYFWKLAHTCSHWRQVLWNTPGVLGSIEVPQHYRRQNLSHNPDDAQVQIVRDSLTYILSVSRGLINIHVGNHLQSPVIDLLLPQAHRIKELKVFGLDYESFCSLLSWPAPSFSRLEELDLQVNISQPKVQKHSVTAFGRSRNLRKLHLNLGIEIIHADSLLLPWRQLTDLAITHVSSPPNTIHHILGQSISLVCATFHVSGDFDATTTHTVAPIRLRDLKEIAFFQREPVDWEHLLQPLVLPALKKLSVEDSSPPPMSWSHWPFTHLLDRSNCVLEVLEICSAQIASAILTEDSVTPLLRALPDVVRLKLHAIIPPSTFDLISSEALLPQLENVVWNMQANGLEECVDFLEAFDSANGEKTNLKDVDIWCHDGPMFNRARDHFIMCQQSVRGDTGMCMRLFSIESGEEIISMSWEDWGMEESSNEGSDEESDEDIDQLEDGTDEG